MTYNDNIITIIELKYIPDWIWTTIAVGALLFIIAVCIVVFNENENIIIAGSIIVITSLVILLIPILTEVYLTCKDINFSKIYVEPSASIEEVEKDFELIKQTKEPNIWIASYVKKRSDYKKE